MYYAGGERGAQTGIYRWDADGRTRLVAVATGPGEALRLVRRLNGRS